MEYNHDENNNRQFQKFATDIIDFQESEYKVVVEISKPQLGLDNLEIKIEKEGYISVINDNHEIIRFKIEKNINNIGKLIEMI